MLARGQLIRKVVPFMAFCLMVNSMPAYSQGTRFPSKFGPDDQVGNLNHITPEKTRRASKLIKQGKNSLPGMETNKDTPVYAPRSFDIKVVQPEPVMPCHHTDMLVS